MRATVTIPLRYFHSGSGNFTLPIRRKPITAALYPFSLKKLAFEGGEKEAQRTKFAETELSAVRV